MIVLIVHKAKLATALLPLPLQSAQMATTVRLERLTFHQDRLSLVMPFQWVQLQARGQLALEDTVQQQARLPFNVQADFSFLRALLAQEHTAKLIAFQTRLVITCQGALLSLVQLAATVLTAQTPQLSRLLRDTSLLQLVWGLLMR